MSNYKKELTMTLDEDSHPCIKEHKLSVKCLNENNFNKKTCQIYMDNYQNCKNFWFKVKMERLRQGKRPLLPGAEERAKIKDEYLQSQKL